MSNKDNARQKRREPIDATAVRDRLKEILAEEIERLPETLNSLEPKDRLNAVLKLIPYFLPKTEAVHYREGEPLENLLKSL